MSKLIELTLESVAELVEQNERLKREQAELAKLRSLADERGAALAKQVDIAERERAAHEATKAELALAKRDSCASCVAALKAAEQRVAELERVHEQALNERDAAHDETWRLGTRAEEAEARVAELELQIADEAHEHDDAFALQEEAWERTHKAEAALSSARELLEREMHRAHVQTEQVLRQRDAFAAALSSARELLGQWLMSAPPLRGARPVEATRMFLSGPAQPAESRAEQYGTPLSSGDVLHAAQTAEPDQFVEYAASVTHDAKEVNRG